MAPTWAPRHPPTCEKQRFTFSFRTFLDIVLFGNKIGPNLSNCVSAARSEATVCCSDLFGARLRDPRRLQNRHRSHFLAFPGRSSPVLPPDPRVRLRQGRPAGERLAPLRRRLLLIPRLPPRRGLHRQRVGAHSRPERFGWGHGLGVRTAVRLQGRRSVGRRAVRFCPTELSCLHDCCPS